MQARFRKRPGLFVEMSIRDEIADALEELEGDVRPESVGGVHQIIFSLTDSDDTLTVPFLRRKNLSANRLVSGGFEDGIKEMGVVRMGNFLTADSTEITVDSDLFTADSNAPRPRVNKLCTLLGESLRIRSAEEDGTGAYILLTLESPHV